MGIVDYFPATCESGHYYSVSSFCWKGIPRTPTALRCFDYTEIHSKVKTTVTVLSTPLLLTIHQYNYKVYVRIHILSSRMLSGIHSKIEFAG